MRIFLLFLLVGIGAAAPAHAAIPPAAFDTLDRDAVTAYRQHDYPRMQNLLEQALVQRPLQPRLLYNLAAAQALQHHAEPALELLARLERMKLSYKLDADHDFDAIRNDPRFTALAAKFTAHGEPRGDAEFAFSGGVARFIPEGIAYDKRSDSFYLSSVHERRILRFDSVYERHPMVDEGRDGLWSAMGMAVEYAKKRLWVASAALPEMTDYTEADRGKSGIFAFSTLSGSLRKKFLLPPDGHDHALGNILLDDKGSQIYVSDSLAGALYRLDREDGGYTTLLAPGSLVSATGLAFDHAGTGLYLADYAQGLYHYDLLTRQLTKLGAPDDICLYGIDSLYFYKDTLVAIQNGISPNRVVRLTLSADGRAVSGMQVLVSNHEKFDEPTKGVIIGSRFYFIANSQWNRIIDHHVPAEDELQRPVVLKLKLDDSGGDVRHPLDRSSMIDPTPGTTQQVAPAGRLPLIGR